MTIGTKYGTLRTKYGSEPNVVSSDCLLMRYGDVGNVGKKKKILTIVDEDTGEVEAHITLEDNIFRKKRWFIMFQDSLAWISGQHMTGEQINVFCNLLSRMDFDNRIFYNREEIANAVGIRPQHVSRAIRILKEKDIIYDDPTCKGFYKLNPHIGSKGKKKFNNNVLEFEKIKYERSNEKQI